MQIVVPMTSGMLVENGKDFKAKPLIKSRGLEAVGRQDHLLTATPPGLLLCSLQELRTDTLATQRVMDPHRLDITTATPGPAFEPGLAGLLVIAAENRPRR